MRKIQWPENRDFAFSIFDDTDSSTIENTKPVYDFLETLGFKTTKSAWVFNPEEGDRAINPGSSIEDREYKNWLLSLKEKGFEIGLHNVASSSSKREKTIAGINRFLETFNYDSIIFANHAGTKDSIYWASSRLTGISKWIYKALTRNRKDRSFVGHLPDSEYYWADYLKKHVKYIRNFTFDEVNTLKVCPMMPYKNPQTPMANFWFCSCDGHNLSAFTKVLTIEKVDRLIKENGACIMYTHFAKGFVNKYGELDDGFKKIMEYIAGKNGWFVPVSDILNHIDKTRGKEYNISLQEHNALSRKWLLEKIRKGGTT